MSGWAPETTATLFLSCALFLAVSIIALVWFLEFVADDPEDLGPRRDR